MSFEINVLVYHRDADERDGSQFFFFFQTKNDDPCTSRARGDTMVDDGSNVSLLFDVLPPAHYSEFSVDFVFFVLWITPVNCFLVLRSCVFGWR